ncbi:MAG: tetratricopeptide repeat protein [Acidimicrobiales bacterium]
MKTTSHLAATVFQLGEITEACELRRHILGVRNRTLGPDDLTTLGSLEHLANTLERIDEFDEAKVIYESLLAKRIRLLGADHSDTQRTRDMLIAIDGDSETDP